MLLVNLTALRAQVVINEFSAANYSDVADSYGNYEDWIELYNTGASSVDLSGYHLSDDVTAPSKWAFPAGATINANAYMRVWCSGRDVSVGTTFHTNFKITQTAGDNVVFSDASGAIIDTFIINIPNQVNQSWGRYPDGSASWYIFTDPTPGTSNTTAHKNAYAEKPNMTPNAGNYAGSVDVTITDSDPLVTIHYTTDGSAPTASSTTYSSPITVSSTTVLRCIGISSDANTYQSFVSTNTYFIDETSTVPIISICGAQVDDLIADGDAWGPAAHPWGSFELFDKDFTLIDESEGEFNEHGNDSWAYAQRSFDFICRDQFGYDNDLDQSFFSDVTDRTEYQRIIVKDAANDNYPFQGGAHMRDAYTHHVAQLGNLDLDERSVAFSIVFLNGEYWGVYDMREKVDDCDYTKYYYDQSEYNIDFIQCWGGTWAAYGTMAAWNPFVNFVTTNDMTIPANYAYATDNLETQSLMDYVLLNTWVVCKDWLNWNTAWWRGYDPAGGAQKWRYALWDEDATYGFYVNYTGIPDITADASPCDPLGLGWVDPNGHIDILNSLLDNPDFHSDYINRFADLINTTFSCDNMIPIADSIKTVLDSEMPRHIDRWGGSVSGWNDSYDDLKNFIEDRCAVIVDGIADCFDVTPYSVVIDVQPEGAGHNVQVSTIVPSFYPFPATYFSGTNISLKAIPAAGGTFDHWEFLHHTPTPGTYDDTVSVSLTHTDTITAWFTAGTPPDYDFSVDVVPAGAGNVTVNAFTPASFPYATSFASGTTINLSESPASGYVFDYWELVNHIMNPTPFASAGYFSLANTENAVAHFKLVNGIDDINNNALNMAVIPNVTSSMTTVSYQLTENAGDLSAALYSVTGELIADLSGIVSPALGEHSFTLDLTSYHLAAGMYMLEMKANNQTVTQRIMMMPQ